MNLREICAMAIEEISGIAVPTSFANNPNLTAKLAFSLANRAGRHLALTFRWNSLLAEHEFITAGTPSYPLPEGFHAFSHLSYWDNAEVRSIRGPLTALQWTLLRRGALASAAYQKAFFIAPSPAGMAMNIWPIKTGERISYFYYTKKWVDTNADGEGDRENFLGDLDQPLIDSDLLVLDLKWRFRKSKGLDWEAEYMEANNLRDTMLDTNYGGGLEVLDFGGVPLSGVNGEGNIPDTGAGL
jgi:hypothetical protein